MATWPVRLPAPVLEECTVIVAVSDLIRSVAAAASCSALLVAAVSVEVSTAPLPEDLVGAEEQPAVATAAQVPTATMTTAALTRAGRRNTEFRWKTEWPEAEAIRGC